MKPLFSILAALIISVSTAQQVDTTMLPTIRTEGFEKSQVMDILSMLTDVHGPRLTNSVGYKNAAEYVKKTLEGWGLTNVKLDYWDEDFGRGWDLKKFALHCTDPVYFPVVAYPKAWSPGLKGAVRSDAVYLDVNSESDLAKYKGKLKGKIVLFSEPTNVNISFEPYAIRFDNDRLLDMANAGPAQSRGRRFRGGASDAQRLAYLKWELCMKEGVVAVLEPSTRYDDGSLLVSGATVPYPPDIPFGERERAQSAKAPKILPQVIVAAEHYNRMVRQIQKGVPVKLEMSLEAQFTTAGPGYNVIGEIPGTDLKDEVVMVGAHLDSWHSATGATDNASGSAVMMEVMRIIKQLGKAPRRTIRIGLWSGEEQGLIGSRSYVKRVMGERTDDEVKLTEVGKKFAVYFNMDNGTGRYRGIYLQGNESARSLFRSWFRPFEDMDASTITLRNTGGTDHLAFDAIGLPGFQFIQDPVDYSSRTHHTTLDLYDKVIADDMKQNSVITAFFAWTAANMDGQFPRKTE